MHKVPSCRDLSRRGFLKLVSAGGIAAVGVYVLFEYAPWLDYDAPAKQIRKVLERDSTFMAQMQGLIRYATLAANSHNTQPWKFVVRPDEIEIHPDYSRQLSVVDPGDRELWISLGCALENLLIAAHAMGYASEVTYPDAADFIHIKLRADAPQGPKYHAGLGKCLLLARSHRSKPMPTPKNCVVPPVRSLSLR